MNTGMTNMDQNDDALRSIIIALLRRRVPESMIASMVYLIDWRCVLKTGAQATRISWSVDSDGPDTTALEPFVLSVRDQDRQIIGSLLKTPTSTLPGMTGDAYAAIIHVLSIDMCRRPTTLLTMVRSTWPVFHAGTGEAKVVDLVAEAAAYRHASPMGVWPNAEAEAA
jgi:hypothetical protein